MLLPPPINFKACGFIFFFFGLSQGLLSRPKKETKKVNAKPDSSGRICQPPPPQMQQRTVYFWACCLIRWYQLRFVFRLLFLRSFFGITAVQIDVQKKLWRGPVICCVLKLVPTKNKN